MKKTAATSTLVALLTGSSTLAPAQSLPTSQPKFLLILREQVKIGHGEDHAKYEAAWPAAYEKAKSAQAYIALVSMTGARESWYVTPFESHAALGENMKREDADPVLSAELERLGKGDADYLSDLRSMYAMARPDLSHGAFPDASKQRFYSITVFHVKPGYDSAFAAVAKSYAAAADRSAPNARWRTYQVMAGAPLPDLPRVLFLRGFRRPRPEHRGGHEHEQELLRGGSARAAEVQRGGAGQRRRRTVTASIRRRAMSGRKYGRRIPRSGCRSPWPRPSRRSRPRTEKTLAGAGPPAPAPRSTLARQISRRPWARRRSRAARRHISTPTASCRRST